MKKTLTAFLAVMLFGAGVASAGQGAALILLKSDGTLLSGELLAVKGSTLILKDDVTAMGITADIDEVDLVQVRGRSKALLGGVLGATLLGGAGVLAGSAANSSANRSFQSNPNLVTGLFAASSSAMAPILGIGGAILGGLVGALVGSSAGREKNFEVTGHSKEDIQKLLSWLRQKAAYPKESY
jgi:hypothetical protein